jgi:two-component system nitrate/nitrite response regulator NarL
VLRDFTFQTEMAHVLQQIRSDMATLASPAVPEPAPAGRAFPRPVDLTRREQEVLRLLASGAATHAIAKTLFVCPATARHHIGSVLSKLGVHSRLEAVTLALRRGLL